MYRTGARSSSISQFGGGGGGGLCRCPTETETESRRGARCYWFIRNLQVGQPNQIVVSGLLELRLRLIGRIGALCQARSCERPSFETFAIRRRRLKSLLFTLLDPQGSKAASQPAFCDPPFPPESHQGLGGSQRRELRAARVVGVRVVLCEIESLLYLTCHTPHPQLSSEHAPRAPPPMLGAWGGKDRQTHKIWSYVKKSRHVLARRALEGRRLLHTVAGPRQCDCKPDHRSRLGHLRCLRTATLARSACLCAAEGRRAAPSRCGLASSSAFRCRYFE